MSDQQQTLSIPSLIILAALSALAVRYFFFSAANTSTASNRPTNPHAARPADVEQIVSMFPQIPPRNIIWDLQRNGGSVAATTERVLATGRLDEPPPTFQPPMPISSAPSTANITPGQAKPEHVDLIKRYNLSDKVSSPPSTFGEDISTGGGAAPAQTWSNNKNERQVLFQRRREEMVLSARRKMQERERQRMGQGNG